MQSESLSPPDSATLNPVRAVTAKNSQTPIVGASPTVASVQQSVAVNQKREIKRETPPVKSANRQESSNASQTPPTVRRTEPQVGRKTTARKGESTPSSSKRSQPKKAKEKSAPPPDDPDDSEPSDSDNDASRGGSSDSSDAESFLSEDEDIGMTTTTTTADGTTIGPVDLTLATLTWRTILEYGISGILVRYDEDSSVQEPDTHSDQGLVYAATQIYTSRVETNATQIQEAVYRRHGFVFGKFFYRLNAAAVKAEVKFKSSSKLRESHIRRLIKKLRNDS
ncbi:hypothetical protein PHMEG_00014540 [Phytophthora megakarya]|uniref:Uncharacterized protein n=1 Tax=Phytophthora megakarya TaxID=4795 RepID=A0A225W627_9STRA|nr:hypothetical protein PHMEG_00014540 [Phytophthora megakarya]